MWASWKPEMSGTQKDIIEDHCKEIRAETNAHLRKVQPIRIHKAAAAPSKEGVELHPTFHTSSCPPFAGCPDRLKSLSASCWHHACPCTQQRTAPRCAASCTRACKGAAPGALSERILLPISLHQLIVCIGKGAADECIRQLLGKLTSTLHSRWKAGEECPGAWLPCSGATCRHES